MERPAKRQRVSPSHEANDNSKKQSAKEDAKEDPILSEFLQVMRPRNKKDRSWANDDPQVTASVVPSANRNTSLEGPSSPQVRTNPLDIPKSTRSQKRLDPKIPDTEPIADDDTVSDLEWMKRRMGQVLLDDTDAVASDTGLDFVQSDDDDAGPNEKELINVDQHPPPIDPTADSMAETSRLFLRNLAYSCSASDLEEAFKPFGELSQVGLTFILC